MRKHLLLQPHWEAGYKVSKKKKPKSASLKSNVSASISLKELGAWKMNENKLCVPSLFPLPENKFESSWEQQDFAESGVPNFAITAKPLYKATKRGKRDPLE
jgi:hypothetical protein